MMLDQAKNVLSLAAALLCQGRSAEHQVSLGANPPRHAQLESIFAVIYLFIPTTGLINISLDSLSNKFLLLAFLLATVF